MGVIRKVGELDDEWNTAKFLLDRFDDLATARNVEAQKLGGAFVRAA